MVIQGYDSKILVIFIWMFSEKCRKVCIVLLRFGWVVPIYVKFISVIETPLKIYYDIYVIDMGLLPHQSFIRGKRINHK